MRRSGVLRNAPALRASLTWSHPDAQLALFALLKAILFLPARILGYRGA